MPKVTSAQNSNQTNTVCDKFFDGQPRLRTHQIKHIDDYEIILPEWLKNCIKNIPCLLYTSPSPRDVEECRMPSSA